jgi:hypothetical protein
LAGFCAVLMFLARGQKPRARRSRSPEGTARSRFETQFDDFSVTANDDRLACMSVFRDELRDGAPEGVLGLFRQRHRLLFLVQRFHSMVKARGKYLMFWPLFKVAICDLEHRTPPPHF